jgi:hypothetical protein
MTPRKTPPPPTARRITASELGTFTFCQRAWFLESQGEPTSLTDAQDRGTADHAERVVSIARGHTTAHAARVLFILGLLAILCALIVGTHSR